MAAPAGSAQPIALDGSLLLVGCGKMGGALLGGWLDRGVAARAVTVIDPQGKVKILGKPDFTPSYRDGGIGDDTLAGREGPIVPLIAEPFGPHYLDRFTAERTLTIDMTAAGGNASLLTLNEDEPRAA